METVPVPAAFQPAEEAACPAHNTGPLIERFAANYFVSRDVRTARIYLPVFWTPWLRQHGFGDDLADLRMYVATIKLQHPGRKFWTVCQYDDGIMLDDPDILVFGAGGNCLTDVPIPLLCDPHPLLPPRTVCYTAGFVGCNTHPLRAAMCAAVHGHPGYFCRVKHYNSWEQPPLQRQARRPFGTLAFREVMQRSKFALAPRGYGPSSFRLYEAIQLGVVPVYISDRFWLPFTDRVNWADFCVMVPAAEIKHLPKILHSVSQRKHAEMRVAGQDACRRLFNMPAVCAAIQQHLEAEILA